MRIGLFRVALVLGFVLLSHAPSANADPSVPCYACHVTPYIVTINGTVYTYQQGGCATPPNQSWGNEDCHTQYWVDPDTQVQTTVECDTSGFGCYYTEVNGGPGAGGNDDEQLGGGGSCSRDAGGYCPAWCSSCV